MVLPGFLQVDDVTAVSATFEDVLLHVLLGVFTAEMNGGSQHFGDVLHLENAGNLVRAQKHSTKKRARDSRTKILCSYLRHTVFNDMKRCFL